MNQTTDELAALRRIIRVIERFRQLVPNSTLAGTEAKEAYPKQHLSGQDWKFWKQLQIDPEELLANKQASVVDQTLSGQQFSRLIGQYRRAGFEVY
ncbi:hypothetical protein [Spirosoma validum]|uniref:Uncharacterized protein n=1 Tax=Spirosoma validum TaxID=2771355 RepID=A0A927GDV0_9BACT|nr:hypothetical protein [Spirosoma validum]MBD2753940.1 hypothetical protein [Spirosoma validum]